MTENLNYISDDELERLIAKVEQEELVAAPPDLTERILEKAAASGKKEFSGYCFINVDNCFSKEGRASDGTSSRPSNNNIHFPSRNISSIFSWVILLSNS